MDDTRARLKGTILLFASLTESRKDVRKFLVDGIWLWIMGRLD